MKRALTYTAEFLAWVLTMPALAVCALLAFVLDLYDELAQRRQLRREQEWLEQQAARRERGRHAA